uniref:ParE toxin of type II toxin-antitoxin system, parDE n=1 Tax=Candidatus Kentrum sp. DK TaxID=2126562 RepID=A0A450TJH7_9GAMM|nr:MAG: ParE toxin of type II toxin-antitoxin system, parDE [Candidatus Kentron sp. DK]
MKYAFHPSARIELHEAAHYYESCRTGLGTEFAKEIHSTVKRITEFPDAWTPMTKNTRRCLTGRFPYGVIYQRKDDEILIIAITQLNRKPDYWKSRIL